VPARICYSRGPPPSPSEDEDLHTRLRVCPRVTSFSPQEAAALLTVRIGDELGGYARCRTISFADTKRFAELLGTVLESTMKQCRHGAASRTQPVSPW
jgi:mRNA-degrading endonuclease toxin of MazEF toxin-antitoxin module